MNTRTSVDRASLGGAGADDPWIAIWPLLGRHIAFHRRLVDVTASVKAALFLSQVIYWTRYGHDTDRAGGWFGKTVQQWELETGLTEREQGTARANLRRRGLLMEERRGLPARLHFRLCVDRLVEVFGPSFERGAESDNRGTVTFLAQLLGPAIAYHRALAEVACGVHAGLLLSRALQLSRQQRFSGTDVWIRRSSRQWTNDLGLTRREQETARRLISGRGLWEERIAGVPPVVAVRVRLDVLLARLLAGAPVDPNQRTALHGDDLATGTAHIVGSVVSKSQAPDPTIARRQIREYRHDSPDSSATLLIQGSEGGDSLQPLHRVVFNTQAIGTVGTSHLIFPDSFCDEDKESARRLLAPVADQAQVILDELAGRMQANAVRSSPIAYLRGLVLRAVDGSFVAEAGIAIRIARRRRAQEEIDRQAQVRAAGEWAQERRSPQFQQKVAERRAQMQQWLRHTQPRRSDGENR